MDLLTADTNQKSPMNVEQFATYSPEDNKLRLYVGRVPREEFLKLRADGWTSTPKQRENGGCDFVATWTPSRRDTALEYSQGVIEDEDQPMAERAADRAERFSNYRDKRTNEATRHADSYDAGPSAHGYQSQARAERAAARHDRIADRSCDAWSKAEYWQRRTAGVISHALYKSRPDVRMGRIKVLEAELRKHQKSLEEWANKYKAWEMVRDEKDPQQQTELAIYITNRMHLCAEYMHPRPETVTNERIKTHPTDLSTLLSMVRYGYGTSDITGAEAAALFFSNHSEPVLEDDWTTHYKLRLAYENQMLEQQGGRAAFVEMEVGGWIGDRQIRKVNKSPATGRVVSVTLKIKGDRWGNSPEGFHLRAFNVERLPQDAYRAPSEEDKAALLAERNKEKAESTKVTLPLINPTDADAERLQALWNERAKAKFEASGSRYMVEFQPSTVRRLTQAVYSANSKGTYAKVETVEICPGGNKKREFLGCNYSEQAELSKKQGAPLCKVRTTWGNGNTSNKADSVIIITDKPQKPLPAKVWENPEPLPDGRKVLKGKSNGLSYTVNA